MVDLHKAAKRAKKRPLYTGIVLGFILAIISGGSAFADVPVTELAESKHLDLEWDPYRRIGILRDNVDRLMFDPVQGTLILNYTEAIIGGTVSFSGDAVVFSDTAARFVREHFADATPPARVVAIVLDPGHGGRDPGASHTHVIDGEDVAFIEKDIVLGVAKDLEGMLKERYPARNVVITRDDDTLPALEERVAIANAVEIDPADELMIFVSIHANASLNPKTYGYEVWYLPPEYERKDLIDSDVVEGADEGILRVLNLMRDDEFTNESIRLAQSILDGFDDTVGDMTRNLGLKEEVWFVVRHAKMPSVLVELGFLTNEYEAGLMNTESYLEDLTEGLFEGITKYIDSFDERYQQHVRR